MWVARDGCTKSSGSASFSSYWYRKNFSLGMRVSECVMQKIRQELLRVTQREPRRDLEKDLKRKSLESLRDFRRVRTAQRCLAANKPA